MTKEFKDRIRAARGPKALENVRFFMFEGVGICVYRDNDHSRTEVSFSFLCPDDEKLYPYFCGQLTWLQNHDIKFDGFKLASAEACRDPNRTIILPFIIGAEAAVVEAWRLLVRDHKKSIPNRYRNLVLGIAPDYYIK